VLAPSVDLRKHGDLPFASSLCGSCSDVCPVRIDLHHQLLAWRGELARQHLVPAYKRVSARIGRIVLSRPWLYRLSGWIARAALRILPRSIVYGRWNAWGRGRELPEPPRESFRAQWRKRVGAR
jgi:L-lactate dehydrogenase complex protein LldF